ncbi:Alpha/Beta hydrolase protein [Coniochaeta sp. 2T2.1]|nr:Alpha/Beta hydrolase protein [Coniochaeta sp. 2T2.1]
MSALTKATRVFATRGIPLECDVYQAAGYPKNSPVLLFFHSGGLVAGGRQDIPPWLVQACVKNKWPVVSASYRLLPQVDGEALLEDAKAAYEFAQRLDVDGDQPGRRVIAAGSSAGFFLATLIAHHLTPKPLALLASSGIPTFRHPFFNSSHQISNDPVEDDDVERILAEPVSVGTCPSSVFDVNSLHPNGAKKRDFDPSSTVPVDRMGQHPYRGIIYDYLVQRNEYLAYVGNIDPGFDWATNKTGNQKKLDEWPQTVMLQGDKDEDVDMDVCFSVATKLGDRAHLIMSRGQGHRFGRESFLEDEPGMDEIIMAVIELEKFVQKALAQ